MHKTIEKFSLEVLKKLNPELAHNLALLYLRCGLLSKINHPTYSRLKTSIAGLKMNNPLGLAAGFDKNAVATSAIRTMGFGFGEVGAVTPKPQSGNKKPRLLRLNREKAIINRFGFNNDGMHKVNTRLKNRVSGLIIGLNIGANFDSKDRKNDFSEVLLNCADNVDFLTINISSPNTRNLRNLQGKNQIGPLLKGIMTSLKSFRLPKPVFLKISPDLSLRELEMIVFECFEHGVSGIVATNTSSNTEILEDYDTKIVGGISGRPLFTRSTKILAQLALLTEGKMPLIGVGGIFSGKDAFDKICAGASLIQLYSALTFFGPWIIPQILSELDSLLKRDGFNHISDAVGTKSQEFAQERL